VQGISGAGMQHGTVFWSKDAETLLGSLDAGKTLLEQLESGAKGERKGAFSHPFSPNWQDASTQKQCDAFDATLQEPRNLALATGSSAHHVSFLSFLRPCLFSGPALSRPLSILTPYSASVAPRSFDSTTNIPKPTRPPPASPSYPPSSLRSS
jgi:hypothetical protein